MTLSSNRQQEESVWSKEELDTWIEQHEQQRRQPIYSPITLSGDAHTVEDCVPPYTDCDCEPSQSTDSVT